MPRHAYSDLPGYCFWRESVAEPAASEVDPVVAAKFKISTSDRVATAGSCFAQHISRRLDAAGFCYLVTETAHPAFNARCYRDFNYGVYSARYGNVYTARQLRQLIERAYGQFAPVEDIWSGEGVRV
ncbi:MAG TPA: GSCFA domain-containing protein, partial [Roseiarcus sp.]|nr:GSCFA domain-containing protein [Roseiarcus sp.]